MDDTTKMILSIAIFLAAYIVIITDKFDRTIVALAGGIIMVFAGLLEQESIFASIDFDTLGLLISMMIIVMIIQRTGVFEYVSIKMVKLVKGEPWKVLVVMSLVTALASSFLDNVTTILLILPIVFDICRELHLKPVPFVISMIFASNIGGTATLVGDPPNMMIGSKAGLSFMDFILNLTPVILIILAVSIILFLLVYRKNLHTKQEHKDKVMSLDESKAVKDKKLLIKSVVILGLTILGFILHGTLGYKSSAVAMAGAVLLLAISGIKPEKVLKEVEWKTIFFFAGLFMMVGGIEQAGVLDLIASRIYNAAGGSMTLLALMVLWVSAILSAFVDNIPFTATMIALLKNIGTISGMSLGPLWWALSLGACLGGNGTVIGSSANVVASGISEENGRKITFTAYFKVCFPIMLLTIGISTVYLILFYLI